MEGVERCLHHPLALQWAFILLSWSFQLCLELLVLAMVGVGDLALTLHRYPHPSLLLLSLHLGVQISVQTKTHLAVLGPASLPKVAAPPSRVALVLGTWCGSGTPPSPMEL